MLSFMHGHRLPQDIRRRIRDFLGHEKSAAAHQIKGTLLENLSPMVQKGILMNIHYDILSSIPLFRHLLHEDSIDHLGSLALRLCTELCNPGDILFRAGDTSRELILIDSGAFILIDAETSSHFATFRSGNFFGENCLLDGQETHVFSAVAESWCLIYRLGRRDFEDVLEDHAGHLQSIRLMAQLRWTRLKQAVEAHRILRCARNHKPGLTSQSLLRVLSTLCAEGEVGGSDLRSEEKGLPKQIRSSSVPSNFWKTVSLKICQAARTDGVVDWDWSVDWVDDAELSKIADLFEESCESAALALKVASYLAQEPKPAVDFDGTSIAGLGAESGLSYASPVHDMEIVLSQALCRLEVVEVQACFIPKLEKQVEMLQASLLAEEESDAHAQF
jgi:CRP-like cAMP-binding protein